MYYSFFVIILFVVVILDILKVVSITSKYLSLTLLIVFPHFFLIVSIFYKYYSTKEISIVYFLLLSIVFIFAAMYFFIRLHFYKTACNLDIGLRTRILMGGRRILILSVIIYSIQLPICYFVYKILNYYKLPNYIFVLDTIILIISLLLFLINGIHRIFYLSKRIKIVLRLLFLFFLWIPPINILFVFYFSALAKKEFDNECFVKELESINAESEICKTKYPILMLHGIGFRDYKYTNYWGRIPKRLIKYGATIYYGNQKAWGTIEDNAVKIKEKLISILEKESCEKVNIIAHSKGGLDARYLISSLKTEDYVASLTTMATPHRGSEIIDVLDKLNDKTYRRISFVLDSIFKNLGDKNPDSYSSSKQLKPNLMEEFNKNNPDSNKVYYQSYTGNIKKINNDAILSIPYAILKFVIGDNDGLVNVDSAKWGNFKGFINVDNKKGVSHGDIIDLTRKDYDNFDLIEEYAKIVSELKEMGY